MGHGIHYIYILYYFIWAMEYTIYIHIILFYIAKYGPWNTLYIHIILFYIAKYGPWDTLYIKTRTKKHLKNEQRSRDAAAKKRSNTSGVGKINNYCEDIYIPPYH